MRWCDDLYIGDNALNSKEEIISNIKEGKFQFNKYVLALPFNEVDLLDIYPSYVLTQKRYMDSDIVIVGIAEGKEEAYDVIQLIIMDCYNKTNGFDVRQYIENKGVFIGA